MKADATSSLPPPDYDLGPVVDTPQVEEPAVISVPRRSSRSRRPLKEEKAPVSAPESIEGQDDYNYGPLDESAAPAESLGHGEKKPEEQTEAEERVSEAKHKTKQKLTEWLGNTFSKEKFEKARDKIRKITGGLTGKETIILPALGTISRFVLFLKYADSNPNVLPQTDQLAALGFTAGNVGMILANRLEAHPEIAYKYARPLKLLKRVSADIVLMTMGYGVEKIGEGVVGMVNDNFEPSPPPTEEPVVGGLSPDERSAEAQPAGGAVTEVSPSATSSPTLTVTSEPTASSTPAPVTETATQIEVPTSSATAVGDLHSIPTDTPSPIPSAVSSLEPSSSAIPSPTETGSDVQPTAAATEAGVSSPTPLVITEADASPTATDTPVPTLIGGEPTGTPEAIPGTEATSSETPAVETAIPSPLPTETVPPEAETAPGGEAPPVEIPVAPSEGEIGLTPPDLTPPPEVNKPLENAVDGIPGNYSRAGRDYWDIAKSATENTADTAGLSEGGRNILTDALKDVIHGPDVTSEDWQNAALRIDHTVDKLDRLLLDNAFENLDFHNSFDDARINEILENVYKTGQLPNLLTAADLRKLEEISMMSGG